MSIVIQTVPPPNDSTYVLGHADSTEYALRLAGLRPGMRLLEAGCGPGDMSFVARTSGRARTWMSRFATTSIADIWLDGPIDAKVGRFDSNAYARFRGDAAPARVGILLSSSTR